MCFFLFFDVMRSMDLLGEKFKCVIFLGMYFVMFMLCSVSLFLIIFCTFVVVFFVFFVSSTCVFIFVFNFLMNVVFVFLFLFLFCIVILLFGCVFVGVVVSLLFG